MIYPEDSVVQPLNNQVLINMLSIGSTKFVFGIRGKVLTSVHEKLIRASVIIDRSG